MQGARKLIQKTQPSDVRSVVEWRDGFPLPIDSKAVLPMGEHEFADSGP